MSLSPALSPTAPPASVGRGLRLLCSRPTPGGSCTLRRRHPGTCLPLPPPVEVCPLHEELWP